ncbi:MAG: hypothetical protein ACRDQD_08845 [Nocardioidaceae bacterium]
MFGHRLPIGRRRRRTESASHGGVLVRSETTKAGRHDENLARKLVRGTQPSPDGTVFRQGPDRGGQRLPHDVTRDSVRDRIKCGPGHDRITYIDHRDRRDDLTGCEEISVVTIKG